MVLTLSPERHMNLDLDAKGALAGHPTAPSADLACELWTTVKRSASSS